jgi:hypothetical protein
MALAATGLFEDLLGGPVEMAEVICKQNPCKKRRSAGATAHPKRNFVTKLQVKTRGQNAGVGEDIDVSGKDQIALDLATKGCIPTAGVDVEILSSGGVDGEVEGHREADRVKAGTKVG